MRLQLLKQVSLNILVVLIILPKLGIVIANRNIIHKHTLICYNNGFRRYAKKRLTTRRVLKQVAQKHKKVSRKKISSTRTRKSHLATPDIKRFKQMLLDKRREILVNVNEMEDEALKKSRLDAAGDLSSMPIHMADIGTDNYDQEFTLGLMDSERKLLREIDDALQRIEQGTYGICEGTGKQIPKARLEAQPWARYCVEYARMLEQGLVTESEQQTPD
jgi:DnaK suppressor protein